MNSFKNILNLKNASPNTNNDNNNNLEEKNCSVDRLHNVCICKYRVVGAVVVGVKQRIWNVRKIIINSNIKNIGTFYYLKWLKYKLLTKTVGMQYDKFCSKHLLIVNDVIKMFIPKITHIRVKTLKANT